MGKIYKNGILFAGSTENARSVTFDNADTGLESTNVQEAIEEIKRGIDSDIENTNSNLSNLFKKVTTSKEYTVTANGATVISISHTIPSGYKILGVVGFYTGHVSNYPLYVTYNRMDIQNTSDSNITATAKIEVLCVKSL